MNFGSPLMLYSALALIPLAAIYLLKVRPTRKTTTTWFLWQGILQERRQTALFHRLRDILSLLLMALAFLACALGMSDPSLVQADKKQNLLIILDRSASMNAQDGRTTRFEAARDLAEDLIRALPSDRSAILAVFDREIRQVVNLTDNQRTLLSGLNRVACGCIPARKAPLRSLLQDQSFIRGLRPILISDGCFPGATDIKGIELFKIGDPVPNIGITDFEMIRLPGGRNRIGVFFRTYSTMDREMDVDVLLCRKETENVVKVFPVTAQPGLNPPETYILENRESGPWILLVDREDAASLDNTAFAVVPPRRPIRVRVDASENSRFVERCVQAFSREAVGLTLVRDDPDIVISDGTRGVSTGKIHRITFAPHHGEEMEVRAAAAVHDEHPAIRFCDTEGIDFTGARRLQAPANALVLVKATDGRPLIWRSTSNPAGYTINLDPARSGFFFSAYFPVMVYSMALELTGRNAEESSPLQPGAPVPGNLPPGTRIVPLAPESRTPAVSGSVRPMRISAPGFYRLNTADMSKTLAVSLLSREESNLDNGRVPDTRMPIPQGRPLRFYLILLAMLLVAAESIFYHRRKVG